jgi:hypothetical protein
VKDLGKLLGAKKSMADLKGDLAKLKTAMKETMSYTEQECDKIIATEMSKRTARGIDERTALEAVVRSLRAQLRGERLSTAAHFNGYILGDRGVYDRVQRLRNEALAAFQRDAKQAMMDGLIDMSPSGDPIVLDTRDTMFGRPNARKGKPLMPENNRTIYGVAVKRDDSSGLPKIFRLSVRNSVATDQTPPLYKPVTFRANIGEESAELNLRHSNRTRWRSYDGEIKPIEEVLDSPLLDGYAFKLNKLEDAAQKCDGDWSFFVASVGDVLAIGNKTDRGSLALTITDDSLGPEETRTVWVPEHLADSIDFGVGSRIVTFGRVRESSYQDAVTWNINADGVYAIPELRTDPGSVFEDQDEDEE